MILDKNRNGETDFSELGISMATVPIIISDVSNFRRLSATVETDPDLGIYRMLVPGITQLLFKNACEFN